MKLDIKINLDPKPIIEEQINIIKEGIFLIDTQIKQIDHKGNTEVSSSELEEEIITLILFTKREYLDFFRKIVTFLNEKIENEKDENFIFYMPNLRSLIEIYAHLFHLSFETQERRATLILSKILFTFAEMIRKGKKKNDPMESEYMSQYKHFEKIISEYSIPIPTNPNLFSKKYLATNNLAYPSVADMLDSDDNFKSVSTETCKIFPLNTSSYEIYSHLSNYVHANTLHKASHGNEKFWVISEVVIYISMILELVDKKILNEVSSLEIKKWLERVKVNQNQLTRIWKNNRHKPK